MDSHSEVLKETEAGVTTITLNRPQRLNAWTAVMERELRAAVLSAASDEATRVLVLTGAGRGFCSGADAAGAIDVSPGEGPRPVGDFNQRYSYLLAVDKPIIGAINGPAAGVGLVLALYCDIRFVASDAKLTTAFSRRGVVAEHGSAFMLSRLIGPMNAADLLLSGRVIEGTEAERLGLARMLPAESFRDQVTSYARDLASLCSPRSLRVMKRQLRLAFSQTLEQATRLSEDELALCGDSEDMREGFAHFLEKRPPRFTGR